MTRYECEKKLENLRARRIRLVEDLIGALKEDLKDPEYIDRAYDDAAMFLRLYDILLDEVKNGIEEVMG